MITIMARKTYSEQFRRHAVELYESTPGCDVPRDRRGPGDHPQHPGGLGHVPRQGIDGQHDGEHERHDSQ
jgi:hypothetical protein